jgi:hypothetical protein
LENYIKGDWVELYEERKADLKNLSFR